MPKTFYPEYLKSIKNYYRQMQYTWDEILRLDLPSDFNEIREIVIAGMGGSNFGARLVKSVFAPDELLVPLEILPNYDLPSYCDEQTLVILMSYSGNTEEVLSALKQATTRGCKLFIIAGGGRLMHVVQNKKACGYIYDTKYNFANAPRTGLGYNIAGPLALLYKLRLLDFNQKEFTSALTYIKKFTEILIDSDAFVQKIADKLYNKIPIFISSDHLTASTWIWRNFLNETAKQNAFCMEIPELNHHFLDGLKFPLEDKNRFIFVFINSNNYHDRNQQRLEITREVVKKQGFTDISISLGAQTKFSEALELIIIGCMVSYHVAKLHNVNPITNEMVDYLKTSLK